MDTDLENLFKEFPELLGDDVVVMKELYAHFGLVFSAYANLEAGIQNCYVFWQMREHHLQGSVKSEDDWVNLHERLEEKAFSATFGSLLRMVEGCEELDANRAELFNLKKIRDYFAHHFFREENSKMFHDETTIKLIANVYATRVRVDKSNKAIDSIGRGILAGLFPSTDISASVDQMTKELKEDILSNPPKAFGW